MRSHRSASYSLCSISVCDVAGCTHASAHCAVKHLWMVLSINLETACTGCPLSVLMFTHVCTYMQVPDQHHHPSGVRAEIRWRQVEAADQAAERPAAPQGPGVAGLDGPPAPQRSGEPFANHVIRLWLVVRDVHPALHIGFCTRSPSKGHALHRRCTGSSGPTATTCADRSATFRRSSSRRAAGCKSCHVVTITTAPRKTQFFEQLQHYQRIEQRVGSIGVNIVAGMWHVLSLAARH